MIRFLLLLFVIFMIYTALKAVVQSAVKGYHEDEKGRNKRTIGEEMVLDPECHTYIVKDRAVTRQIQGTLTYFCSDACARRHEDKNRA
jgi:YHS domain-containing protein